MGILGWFGPTGVFPVAKYEHDKPEAIGRVRQDALLSSSRLRGRTAA